MEKSNEISIVQTYRLAKQAFDEAEKQSDQDTKHAQQAGTCSFLLKMLALDLKELL